MIYIDEKNGLPTDMGLVDVDIKEMMFVMYMPVKLKGKEFCLDKLPRQLLPIQDLLSKVLQDTDTLDKYVYVTCKRTYVTPNSMSNRKGIHIDGFGNDDINYVWCDEVPTEFFKQKMQISEDDRQSMIDMCNQTDESKIITYPSKTLLKLEGPVPHRVSENSVYEGMRTFVKISISDHKFNLEGNAKNYNLDYDWKMYSRDELRNMECNDDMVDVI